MYRLLSLISVAVISLQAEAQFQGLIVNEFSQGNTGSREYIELLVVGNRTCTDSTADLRGWIIDDQNGWYWNNNGANGHYRFKNVTNWEKVPFGAIILLYNAASGSKNLSIALPDDPTDNDNDLAYILPINSPAYLDEHDNEPVETAGPFYQYPPASATIGYGGATNTWIAHISLNNNGDVISLVSPADRSAAYFSINYGITIGAGYQLPTVSIPNVAGGQNAYLSTASFTNSASWVIATVPANETPGLPNGGVNTSWITTMRMGRPGITAASFTPPVCFNNAAQQTRLTYSSTRNSPTHYNITWNAAPANSFAAVNHAALPVGSLPVSVPAGTLQGTYTGYLTVQNASGLSCITDTFTVTVLPPPNTPVTNVLQPTCIAPGRIEVTLPTGVAFSYSIDGVNYQSSAAFSNLNPGNYTVWVKDGNGCLSSVAVVINPVPVAPPVPVVLVQQPSCTNPTGDIIVTSPTGPGLLYSIDGINFQATTVFAGLLPGGYPVIVKNGGQCVASLTATINAAPATPLAPVVAVVNNCDGTSTLTASGIVGSLLWSNGATTNSIVVTTAAAYTATQTVNGCTSALAIGVAVPGTLPPVPVLTVIHPSCLSATGSIAVNSPLGVGYEYSMNGSVFSTVTQFEALATGNYTITVRNSQGCTSAATVAILPPPAVPSAPAVNVIQPDCMTATGSIQVVSPITGYGYSIDGVDHTNTSGIFSNLSPGIYNVTAMNGAGCISAPTRAVINTQPVTPILQVNSPVVCPGNTATLTATVSPAGTYTYVWTLPAGVPDPGNVGSFTSAVAGTYSVVVSGLNGCSSTAAGVISINALAVVSADDKQLCVGGSVMLTGQPAGGVWSGPGVSGSQFNAVALTPGIYTITYSYMFGSCSGSATAAVTVKPVPALPVISVSNQCNETSVLTASNYSGSLLWSNGSTASSITVNAAGNYMLVQTVNGCTSAAAVAVANPLSAPPAPAIVTLLQPNCIIATGTAIVVSGGTGILYSIDALSITNTTGQFANLLPGMYSITARNSDGCVSSPTSVNILPAPVLPSAPAVQITEPDCSGSRGTITVLTPIGAGLHYSIDGNTYQSSPLFVNLSPGNYFVQVRNSSGCVSPVEAVQIQSPAGTIYSSVTACVPEGGSYHFNGQVLTTTGAYSTTFMRPGSCDSVVRLYLLVARTERQEFEGCGMVVFNGTNYSASVIVLDTVKSVVSGCDSIHRLTQITVHAVPVSGITVCLPAGATYHFNGHLLTNSGYYTGTFTTANGCDSIVHLFLTIAQQQTRTFSACGVLTLDGVSYTKDTVLVKVVSSVTTGCDSLILKTGIVIAEKPALTLTPNQTICRGNTIELNAWANNAVTDWVGFGAGSAIRVSPIVTTTYTAIATAASGCADTAYVTIAVAGFDCWLTASASSVLAGSRVVLTSAASSSYQVLSWQPHFSNPAQTTQVLVADSTQVITVRMRSSEGCIDSASVLVVVEPLADVYIPDAFTPNGDGRNDLFLIAGGNFKTFGLKIFNRWGQTVFYSTGRFRGWDGRRDGKELPSGTYVYLLSGTLKDGRAVERKGTVTLIR